jgi:alpha-tubulin suppressor-like RCC1 family protein
LKDGKVVVFGDSSNGGGTVPPMEKDVKTVYSTDKAFAALLSDGSVTVWGDAESGGSTKDGPRYYYYTGVPQGLANVVAIYATSAAFAAILGDGSVQVWGSFLKGGARRNGAAGSDFYFGVPSDLSRVWTISTTDSSFAALTMEGRVYAWGDARYGGSKDDGYNYNGMPSGLVGVQAVYSTGEYAFAALLGNGSVQVWGNVNTGGLLPSDMADVTDVRTIYSTDASFAALLKNGTVKVWGHKGYGGVKQPDLVGVQTIYSNHGAFAAVLGDGSVKAWGNLYGGGAMYDDYGSFHTYTGVPKGLVGVQTIYSTTSAFAAVLEDGSVKAWGHKNFGGSGAPSFLVGVGVRVRAIASTERAFAALFGDGSVRVWGDAAYGGNKYTGTGLATDYTPIERGLVGVQAIASTERAFAALMEDGSLKAWGWKAYGGSGTSGSGFDVVFGMTTMFADSTIRMYPCFPGVYVSSDDASWPNCPDATFYPTMHPSPRPTRSPTHNPSATPTTATPTSNPSSAPTELDVGDGGDRNSKSSTDESEGGGETIAIAGAAVAVLLLLMAAGTFYYMRRQRLPKKADGAAQQQTGAEADSETGPQDVIPSLTENPMHNSSTTATTTTTTTTDDPKIKSTVVDATALYGEDDIEGMDIEASL